MSKYSPKLNKGLSTILSKYSQLSAEDIKYISKAVDVPEYVVIRIASRLGLALC